MSRFAAAVPGLHAHRARELFFGQGETPEGLVDAAILDSWRRCADQRPASARVGFNIQDRSRVEELRGRNTLLIRDFEATLGLFARVLHESGFHPVLTDAEAVTIARFTDPREASGALYDALQLGCDMSEQAIGTAAMNCALACQRPVQVFGHEHYFEANAAFYCAAAPIFDPAGQLVGAVNLTKHREGREFGAISLAESCASAIEHRQLERLRARLTLRMSWSANGESRNATVAFGADGEVLGMTREARRILNPLGLPLAMLSFESVFDGQYGQWLELLAQSGRPLPIRLNSGLFVFIETRSGPPARQPLSMPRATAIANAGHNAPEMGDPEFAGRFRIALKALDKGLPVLLRGETGSGKEVVAHALHRQQPAGPFIAINCAALPEALIESELFGYTDGAFTGGRKGGASGRIEEADGGTLFLDEIGDMPLALQARLLRVLDSREVARLGSGKPRPVEFRLLCATHQDLDTLVAQGRFRADLYYRIAGYTLALAPLRERRCLADLFATLVRDGAGHPGGLAPEATALLAAYPWPGNAREALSVLKRAALLCEADEAISADHVRFALPPATLVASQPVAATASATAAAAMAPTACSAQPAANAPPTSLSALEEQAMADALRLTGGNLSLAADHLGVSRSTLQRRVRASARLKQQLAESRG